MKKNPIVKDMPTFILENYIDLSLCDKMVEEFQRQTGEWTNSARGYHLISSENMESQSRSIYKQEIRQVLRRYVSVYADAFEGFASLTLEEPFNLQKYYPEHHYSVWHCENNGQPAFKNRVLAFMTYLNDVEDGGETEFMYQNMKVTPKKGKTLMWPAYFTHTHRGLPSKTETKYIVTGWVQLLPWVEVDLDMSDEDFFSNLNQDTEVTW